MRYLIVLLLLSGYSAISNAESEASLDQALELKVKPVLCIIDNRTPNCDLNILVFWQSERRGYYCLFSDFEEEALKCWTEMRTGELSDKRSVEAELSYWMTDDDIQSVLAVAKVEVLSMKTDDRRRNRRSSHVWDIF